MTNYNVDDQSELTTAAGSAGSGDTITFTTGFTATVSGVANGVTVTGPGVTMGKVTVDDCGDVTFYDITVQVTGAQVEITGDNGDLVFDRITTQVSGMESFDSWDDFPDSSGFDFNSLPVESEGPGHTATSITVRDCKIQGVRTGIRFITSTLPTLTIQNCIFEYMREDCIKISGGSPVTLIEDCLFPVIKHISRPDAEPNLDHPDCIQNLTSTTDCTIRGCIALPGSGAINFQQGIFFSNGSPTGVLLEQNIMANNAYPGVTCDDGGSSQVINNNLCINYQPGGGGVAVTACAVTSGTMARNWNMTWKSSVASTGTPSGSNFNLYTGYEGANGSAKHLWDYYQVDAGKQSHAGMRGTLTMDDLLPVADSLTDRSRDGASDTNTYGPFDTISRWHAGTWGHYSLRSSGISGAAALAGGVPILLGGRLVVAA